MGNNQLLESHPLSPLVRRWSKYAPLSRGDIDALLSMPFSKKTGTKDSYLVRDGQRVSDCTLLLSGFAFRQKLLRNGGRQIISFHIPTEFVDLQNGLLSVAEASSVSTPAKWRSFRVAHCLMRQMEVRISGSQCGLKR